MRGDIACQLEYTLFKDEGNSLRLPSTYDEIIQKETVL